MSASDFVRFLIGSLVQYPDDILIEQKEDELGTLITLKVNKSDMKVIIGRDGQTISSIRTILRVFGSKKEQRVNLKVIEDL